MIRKKTRNPLPYEAPEVNLVKIDVSNSIMQESITTTSIPDLEQSDEINWL